ncbi:MAG TPA: hypothetical protein VHO84_06920 [Syntrophorhabdaceae bacterium]|nr:hypothetical protein [Syntrophorhabdaceae bacterium]
MKGKKNLLILYFVILTITFLLVTTTGIAADVGYSAMVMDMKGKVSVQRAGKIKAVDLGYLFYPGDLVELVKEASLIVAYLESGREEQWTGGAKFTVEKNGSKPAPAKVTTKNKISVPQIKPPQKGSLAIIRMSPSQAGGFTMKSMPPPQRGALTMYETDSFKGKVAPLGTMAVGVTSLSNTKTVEERPMFRWRADTSAQNYEIEFYDYSRDEPAWRIKTEKVEAAFPPDMPGLRAGHDYKWVISALKDGRVVAQRQSCFGLPVDYELAEIKKEIGNYRDRLKAEASDTSTRMRFIVFLEQHQLYDDALEQYRVLGNQNKESDSLAERQRKIIELRDMACTD